MQLRKAEAIYSRDNFFPILTEGRENLYWENVCVVEGTIKTRKLAYKREFP